MLAATFPARSTMRRYLPLTLLLLLAGCSTQGSFFGPTNGPIYLSRDSDPTLALLYIYRPRSDWASQELEAPGVFVDNQRIGRLPSDSFMRLQAQPGSYKIEMRRPLFGTHWTLLADGPFDFTRIASFTLELEPGRQYFLRYSELDTPAPHEDQTDKGDGPLRLVGHSLARQEIVFTNRIHREKELPLQLHAEHERPQRGFWRSVGEALDKIGI